MPVKSYLAYPVRGRYDELAGALRALRGCEVIPGVNRDLLVVITDTPNDASDEVLGEELARVASLEGLVLVAGLRDANADAHLPLKARRSPAASNPSTGSGHAAPIWET